LHSIKAPGTQAKYEVYRLKFSVGYFLFKGNTMSHHDKLIEAFEAYKAENEKFQGKGIKASAARARKALQDIANSCKERRKEITTEKETLEGKPKGDGMSQDAARHAHIRK
jgi:hypothetical protein